MNEDQQKLVIDNTKLVYTVIKKHYPTFYGNEDITQVGMLGLCKAATTWDSSKSVFSTYACICIHNEIRYYFRSNIHTGDVLSLDYEYEGGTTLSEAIEGDNDVASTVTFEDFLEGESDRTKLVIKLFARGYNSKEISDITGLKRKTISRIKRLTHKKWEGIVDYEQRSKNSN